MTKHSNSLFTREDFKKTDTSLKRDSGVELRYWCFKIRDSKVQSRLRSFALAFAVSEIKNRTPKFRIASRRAAF